MIPELVAPFTATGGVPGGFDAPRMLGVEQEYDLFAGNRQLDFRALFARSLARRRWVPFRNCDSAAILDAGYMLACDGQEAEFATAPIDYYGEGCLSLGREVMRCRKHMLKLLRGIGVPEVRGYSTHLSISVPAGREWELATALSMTAAPALILLMEGRPSPGLLIRPRRGRLEIGSEYIDDEMQLAAASVFLTGVVQAWLFDESLWAQFPHVRLMHSEEANIRPGIYLPRDAFGESIYEHGRTAKLELENGGKMSAGELLETCSRLALEALDDRISSRAANSLLRVVEQSGSLQIEQRSDPGSIASLPGFTPLPRPARTLQTLALAQGRLGLTARFVDWEGAAFSLNTNGKPKGETKNTALVVGVPWAQLPAFFNTARKKDLPGYVGGLGAARAELSSVEQLQTAGVFHAIDPQALGLQALSDKGSGKGQKGDPGKPSGQLKRPVFIPSGEPPTEPPTSGLRSLRTRLPRWTTGLAIFTGLVVIITVGIITLTSTVRRTYQTPTPTNTSSPTVRTRTVFPPTTTPSGTVTWTATPTVTASPTPTRRRVPILAPSSTPPDQNPPACDPQVDPNCPPPPPPPTACIPGLPCP